MATIDIAPRYAPAAIETIGHEDFETASIRSAAPSYISDAPSYHSTAPTADPAPPYSPPAQHGNSPAPLVTGSGAGGSRTGSSTTATTFSMVPPEDASQPRQQGGLPPVPAAPMHVPGIPSLGQFRIPTISANPNARHYHRVAHRRATAASSSSSVDISLQRALILSQLVDEEERMSRVRPLEDPYLVGEHAAAQARRERLARENGDDILIREDRRWDLFLAQMKEREEREKSWKRFRRDLENGRGSSRLAYRLGAALGSRS